MYIVYLTMIFFPKVYKLKKLENNNKDILLKEFHDLRRK